MKLEDIIKLKLNNFEIKVPKKMADLEDACWEGYEPIGTKELDGKTVPNCVPIKAKKVKEGFPIPSREGDEDENTFMRRCMENISGEYDQDQALAICYAKYRE
jgi:hypothetical protein